MTAPPAAPPGAEEAPRSAYNMNVRAVLTIVVGGAVALGLHACCRRLLPGWSGWAQAGLTLAVAVPVVMFLIRRVIHRGLRDGILAVSDGLLSLTERDYNMRLALERRDEVGLLIYRFNRLAEQLRRERNELVQRELIPETILEATSMVVLLCNQAERVVYANPAARRFLDQGRPVEGRRLADLLAGTAPELKAALQTAAETQGDVLFTSTRPGADEPETFQLSRRLFEFSLQRHTLFILRPLAQELARKEVETWKKAIRVLSHEMNNSLAPITSLVQTARLMLENPAHAARLRAALDTIEERAGHLKGFLDGYASFARLPQPRPQPVPWASLLAGVEGLFPFRVEGPLPAAPAHVDAGQLQQVLINLLKNAAESGSPTDEIVVAFRRHDPQAVELEVRDRGRGMTSEVMGNALLPFYSTKKSGSGLGLALCREIVEAHGGRLSLHHRPGGGLTVRVRLPVGPKP